MNEFIAGVTAIPASGTVLGPNEKDAMIEQVSKGWLTAGVQNQTFEAQLAKRWGTKNATTCNSGSSANLLAVAAMVESGKWKAGDEIITVAASFPTTINPLLLYNLVPVFVDVDIGTYNATFSNVEAAINGSTKGIMLAHTLGHPFPKSITGLSIVHDLEVIEDGCDAFGSGWIAGDGSFKPIGSQCAISTCSFFPAHHITTGEGGAVFTNNSKLATLIESICSWGRDCYCDPGSENTCGKRFEFAFDNMPVGYDHKYTYTALGYNLKMTEVQAVCGIAQLAKVDEFIANRKANWKYLLDAFKAKGLEEHLILPVKAESVMPSWFGFVVTLRKSGERTALQQYLSTKRIGSRLLFGGNITRQPYMKGRNFRQSGTLANTDKIMEDTLWVGVHPNLTQPMLDYIAETMGGFFC